MKKITLPAAFLALTMMGCSESGLDNSVASITGEAQNETTIEFYEKPDVMASVIMVQDSQGFYNGSSTYHQKINGHEYSFLIASRPRGSWLHINVDDAKTTVVDYVHVRTACVQGCDAFGNCQASLAVDEVDETRYRFYRAGIGDWSFLGSRCNGTLPSDGGPIGVVSTFAAVLNAGKSDEVIMQSAIYQNLDYNQT